MSATKKDVDALMKYLTPKQGQWMMDTAARRKTKPYTGKDTLKAFNALTPGQQKMFVTAAHKRGMPISGGFFGKIFRSVVKPLVKRGLDTAQRVGETAIKQKLGLEKKGGNLKGKSLKLAGESLALAGQGKRKKKIQK